MTFETHTWTALGLQALGDFRHELLLFTAFWLIVAAIDEFVIDCLWLKLRIQGRGRAVTLPEGFAERPLTGRAAVMIPTWKEAAVIDATVAHTLSAWAQQDYTLYVGCYPNDPDTSAAARLAGAGDPRLKIVEVGHAGPTTKADCLNHLYRALCEDERRTGVPFRSVVLQDAEDMVHPAGLAVIDAGLDMADFVQIPVKAEIAPHSRWVGGHYADEFTEAHGKDLVVRDALGAAIPAAGVGCGFSREALGRLAGARSGGDQGGPFSTESLTEDYELGLLITRQGGRGRFLRARDPQGNLVATRCYFPDRLETAIRQKTRWIHGIAFQGWDRLGWSGRAIDRWMALRDRRGPLTTLVLTAAYLLVAIEILAAAAKLAGYEVSTASDPALQAMTAVCLFAFAWRMVFRFGFTARQYGAAEGVRAVLRVPVANIVAILAGRRALVAYLRTLAGGRVVWDKTEHSLHPARLAMGEAA